MFKKLIPFSLVLVTGMLFISCTKDPMSANSVLPMTTGSSGSTAHPAWTYPRSTTIKNVSYYTVAVSDSDGTHAANVYTSASSTNRIITPTWSSSGGSVSFVEGPNSGWGAYAVKAVDVSVVNGVATGSNSRTIYGNTTSDSIKVRAQAWSQTSTVAKIAFVGQTPAGYNIYTVSTSGGSATKIYSTASSLDIIGASIAWSNDGTELTFAYKTASSGVISIKVIDASTGTENADLISGTYKNVSYLTWSHAGSNTIGFSATTSTSGSVANYNVYTIAPTNGSTETKIHQGINAFWSPDNSEMVMLTVDANNIAQTSKVVVSTGVLTNVGANASTPYGDWKQP